MNLNRSEFVLLLSYLSLAFAQDCAISDAFESGSVADNDLVEASGLAASRLNPGVLYSHNDNGEDYARIFAFLENGERIAEIILEGADFFDYEDITIGPGPDTSLPYIYVGDIGNNDYGTPSSRTSLQIYRFLEPDLSNVYDETITIPSSSIVRFDITTPFLQDEDYETLMCDPVTGAIYLISKNHDEADANVYKWEEVPPTPGQGEIYLLPLVANIDYELLVAGDISLDGTRILLRRGHNDGAYMWARNVDAGQTVEEALTSSAPCDLILVDEEQGEAIAVSPLLDSFYTTSEGQNQPIYKYTFFAK